MNGLYINAMNVENESYFGVAKKIIGQVKAFNKLGINMESVIVRNKKIYLGNKFVSTVNSNYLVFLKIHKYLKSCEIAYDFIYIRYSVGNIFLLKLCKFFKNNKMKVIIELPTFPYKNEVDMSRVKNKVLYIIDDFVIGRLKKYVFRIATTSLDREIYGVECINFNNGIDMEEIGEVRGGNQVEKINFIGVANVNKWHGYDRLIVGLDKYYKQEAIKYDVKFYIVGNGQELQNLKNLVQKLNIQNHVIFTGSKRGNELEEIYNECNIGVSSLALFRAGGGHDPIKTKEYLAKGLPVMLGYEDKLVNMKLPFIFKVKEDNTLININNIIHKYINLNFKSEEIRQYAKTHLSWEAQVKKILENIS